MCPAIVFAGCDVGCQAISPAIPFAGCDAGCSTRCTAICLAGCTTIRQARSPAGSHPVQQIAVRFVQGGVVDSIASEADYLEKAEKTISLDS